MAASGRREMGNDVGTVLRSIRNDRKLTLGDVSQRTGIPISTLSKMENGHSSLSYDKLLRLTRGLEIDITSLFNDQPVAAVNCRRIGASANGGRRSITRAGHGKDIQTAPYDYNYPSVDLLHKALTPMIVNAKYRTIDEFGELIRHPGEEFALVLEGAIAFHTDIYAPEVLDVGDSVYFDSSMGHAYLAASPGRCVLLSVCSVGLAELDSSRPEPVVQDLGAQSEIDIVSRRTRTR